QNLPVVLAIDRAGLVGADGATHHGAFDLSYLQCIPNMVIMAPADENECRQMLYTAYMHDGPTAVRYPRGSGMGVTPECEMTALPIGKGEIRRRGKRVAILAFGSMLPAALAAGEELDATVVNMRFVKPLDTDLLRTLEHEHDLFVTVEENSVIGGAGAEVNRQLALNAPATTVVTLGLPDVFIDHGEQGQLMAQSGLSTARIVESVRTAGFVGD
ncbi:MAG: 1-deoxy-D-xylulose-5-phosphate synthase, partial [Rhodocyclaceae bacterium]|nr:1-deoxy-D-xylulose-5-phosphate synthase [Rhodocyclaceae bacterium]